jgi:hypothetical protein
MLPYNNVEGCRDMAAVAVCKDNKKIKSMSLVDIKEKVEENNEQKNKENVHKRAIELISGLSDKNKIIFYCIWHHFMDIVKERERKHTIFFLFYFAHIKKWEPRPRNSLITLIFLIIFDYFD